MRLERLRSGNWKMCIESFACVEDCMFLMLGIVLEGRRCFSQLVPVWVFFNKIKDR